MLSSSCFQKANVSAFHVPPLAWVGPCIHSRVFVMLCWSPIRFSFRSCITFWIALEIARKQLLTKTFPTWTKSSLSWISFWSNLTNRRFGRHFVCFVVEKLARKSRGWQEVTALFQNTPHFLLPEKCCLGIYSAYSRILATQSNGHGVCSQRPWGRSKN